jgi:hypothetical protein
LRDSALIEIKPAREFTHAAVWSWQAVRSRLKVAPFDYSRHLRPLESGRSGSFGRDIGWNA